MICKDDRKGKYILPASTLASLISACIVNPLDVLKVRQQKGSSADCHVHNKPIQLTSFPSQFKSSLTSTTNNNLQQQQSKSRNSLTTSSITCQPKQNLQRSKLQLIEKNKHSFKLLGDLKQLKSLKLKPQYNYAKSCVCLDKKNIIGGIAQIWRMEGIKTFYNGLRYSLYSSTASTVAYFYFYETSTQYIKNHITQNKITLPLIAATLSRGLTTSITFPLEYWRTLQQAQIGSSQKTGMQLGNRLFSAYFVTLQRDIIFSSLYWVLAENIRDSLHGFWCNYTKTLQNDNKNNNVLNSPEHQQYHKNEQSNNQFSMSCKTKFLLTNVIAGSVAGGITALVTLPLDVVKTKRQLYENYAKQSSIEVMKTIVEKDGFKGLYAGVRPRIAKVIVACSTMLSLYEYFLSSFKQYY